MDVQNMSITGKFRVKSMYKSIKERTVKRQIILDEIKMSPRNKNY